MLCSKAKKITAASSYVPPRTYTVLGSSKISDEQKETAALILKAATDTFIWA